jgi:hypothetical protein
MKKAAVAVAHRLLKIAYSLIRHGGEYRERGGDHFDRRNPEKTARKLVSRLERVGLLVTVTRPLRKKNRSPNGDPYLPGTAAGAGTGDWRPAFISAANPKPQSRFRLRQAIQ